MQQAARTGGQRAAYCAATQSVTRQRWVGGLAERGQHQLSRSASGARVRGLPLLPRCCPPLPDPTPTRTCICTHARPQEEEHTHVKTLANSDYMLRPGGAHHAVFDEEHPPGGRWRGVEGGGTGAQHDPAPLASAARPPAHGGRQQRRCLLACSDHPRTLPLPPAAVNIRGEPVLGPRTTVPTQDQVVLHHYGAWGGGGGGGEAALGGGERQPPPLPRHGWPTRAHARVAANGECEVRTHACVCARFVRCSDAQQGGLRAQDGARQRHGQQEDLGVLGPSAVAVRGRQPRGARACGAARGARVTPSTPTCVFAAGRRKSAWRGARQPTSLPSPCTQPTMQATRPRAAAQRRRQQQQLRDDCNGRAIRGAAARGKGLKKGGRGHLDECVRTKSVWGGSWQARARKSRLQ